MPAFCCMEVSWLAESSNKITDFCTELYQTTDILPRDWYASRYPPASGEMLAECFDYLFAVAYERLTAGLARSPVLTCIEKDGCRVFSLFVCSHLRRFYFYFDLAGLGFHPLKTHLVSSKSLTGRDIPFYIIRLKLLFISRTATVFLKDSTRAEQSMLERLCNYSVENT